MKNRGRLKTKIAGFLKWEGEMKMERLIKIAALVVGLWAVLMMEGCTTIGYHHAKDPNLVKKWDVTVTQVSKQNIYNALGASLVGPLASVDAVGLRVDFITTKGEKVEIVQPSDNSFLHFSEVKKFNLLAGQQAVYLIDRGQVWVQPVDFPLPTEFLDKH